MSLSFVFTKALAASSANNIALSQSPGSGAILLNGSTANYLSTTTTTATAAGGTVLKLTATTNVVVGQSVTDSTAAVIPTGTVVTGVSSSSVTLSRPVGGVGVGSGDTIVFAGTATLDSQRRVLLTSGGNDSGINFTVSGTNDDGNAISDTFAGANGSTAQSNLDFKTVTSITASGAVAGTLIAGTNGVGSSPWKVLDRYKYPFEFSFSVELVSGAANFTVQYTYDDPNNLPSGVSFPLPFSDAGIQAATATSDGAIGPMPVSAVRLLINSGTGTLRFRGQQAGYGG